MASKALKLRLSILEEVFTPPKGIEPIFVKVIDCGVNEPGDTLPRKVFSDNTITEYRVGGRHNGVSVSRVRGEPIDKFEARVAAQYPDMVIFMATYGEEAA